MTNETIVREGLKDTDALAILDATCQPLKLPARLALWANVRKYAPGGIFQATDNWADVAEGVSEAALIAPLNAALIHGCIRKCRERRLAKDVQRDPWAAAMARVQAEDARRTTK